MASSMNTCIKPSCFISQKKRSQDLSLSPSMGTCSEPVCLTSMAVKWPQQAVSLSVSPVVGGPAGEFPANIFEPGKISEKILHCLSRKQQQKTSGNKRTTDGRGGALLTMTFSPLPSLPPLDQTISFPSQGNQYLRNPVGQRDEARRRIDTKAARAGPRCTGRSLFSRHVTSQSNRSGCVRSGINPCPNDGL